ncbi:hypothetical protein PLESTB_001170700 [Pleodorina starrii]|uniref:Wax synthase domain-containing protein n=1 Tax=Pleodorina starrii TaxID=330485 RepID=A0A9W6BRP0_9CHLO|nr:hypothetical protein PLESTB_001170700 [Pleodorina starrii]GLC64821.1 hypothetical protein PLESTF_000211000 [Pleodorina starrii]
MSPNAIREADPRVGTSADAVIQPLAAPPPSATAFMLLPSLDWRWRLQLCVLLLWLCTIWTHQVVLPRRPGWHRLLAAMPAVVALITAPFLFHPYTDPILSMSITFMSVRMPLTKLLAACYGRGPLTALPLSSRAAAATPGPAWVPRRLRRFWPSLRRGGTAGACGTDSGDGRGADSGPGATCGGVPDLALVTFFMLCPVVPRGCRTDGCGGSGAGGGKCVAEAAEGANGGGTSPVVPGGDTRPHRPHSAAYRARGGDRLLLLRELAGKWLAFAAACALAVRYASTVPLALHAALAYGMLAVMGGLMDLMALYCTAVWGVDLVPPFHNPFQATSLSDFWSRRWNVTQSRVLKGLLYDPIVEGRLVPRDDDGDDAAASGDRGACDGDAGGGGGAVNGRRAGDAGGGGGGEIPHQSTARMETRPHTQLRRRRPLSSSSSSSAAKQAGGSGGSEAVSTGGSISGSSCSGGGGKGGGKGVGNGVSGGSGSGPDSDGSGVAGRRPGRWRWQRGGLGGIREHTCGLDRGGGRGGAELAPLGPASETSDPDSPQVPATPVNGAAAAFPGDSGPKLQAAAAAAAAPAALAAASAAVVACCGWLAVRWAASLRDLRHRRAVALVVVFAFSGLEHEIFHWYVQRFLSGRWFVFFTVHGFLLLAEAELRRTAHAAAASAAIATRAAATATTAASECSPNDGSGRSGPRPNSSDVVVVAWCRGAAARLAAATVRLPVWCWRLATLAVLELTASWWFFGVLLEPGIVGRTVAALRGRAPELPS